MAEANTQTPPEGNDSTQNNGGKQNESASETFTQKDMDNLAAKVRAEEKAKIEKNQKESIDKAISDAKVEWERQSKLTAEQREEEARRAKAKEFEERERKLALGERRLEAVTKLAEKNIPTDMVDFLIDVDEAKTNENIDKFSEAFNKAVEAGVKEKLAGETPTDSGKNSTQNQDNTIGVNNGQGVTSF